MVKYSVKASNLVKVYKSGGIEVKALDGVSFSLKEGEFAAIVGPSGSGKSTLMHILGTIDKQTSGDLYIDGISTKSMDGDALSEFRNQKLGFVFQAFNLIPGLTAEKNVELPLMVTRLPESERTKRADGLLGQLGLSGRTQLDVNKLSGGEQQRVALARALVNNPTLILADEPTGNLDSKSGDAVVHLLSKTCKESGVTIVMVTHNLETARFCDRIIFIKDGKIEKEKVM